MKILRGTRAVGHAQIVFTGELEKSFEPRVGVIGALSFVSVREQQHDRGLFAPLGSSRNQKLIDDDLSGVGKVSKLRFPQHERFRRMDAVAVLESKHSCFTQWAVIHRKGGSRLWQ